MIPGLLIFRDPKPGKHYCWGGDVAEGLPHGDNSALDVGCVETGEQVASYCGKLDPKELGDLAYDLGSWYFYAYGCFENNKDLTPQSTMLNRNPPYPNYHHEEIHGTQNQPVETLKPGWNTNTRTRYLMVHETRKLHKDGSLVGHDDELCDELEIFGRNQRGKYEAIAGGHDDRVMAHFIRVMMWQVCLGRMADAAEDLEPMVAGKVVRRGVDDIDTFEPVEEQTREARLADHALEKRKQEYGYYESTAGSLI